MSNFSIVADESVDFRIVEVLRDNGISVFSIAENNPSISDAEVLTIAVEHNALLLTEDKDFGELVYRFGMKHCGILLIRLIASSSEQKAEITRSVLNQYADELKNVFAVLDERRLRLRK